MRRQLGPASISRTTLFASLLEHAGAGAQGRILKIGSDFPNLAALHFLGYLSHMDAPVNQLSAALNRAVLHVLRALVKVLIRHGLALPAFVELAKRAYVDVAMNDFSIPG